MLLGLGEKIEYSVEFLMFSGRYVCNNFGDLPD